MDDITKAIESHGERLARVETDLGGVKADTLKLNQKLDKLMDNDLRHLQAGLNNIEALIKFRNETAQLKREWLRWAVPLIASVSTALGAYMMNMKA